MLAELLIHRLYAERLRGDGSLLVDHSIAVRNILKEVGVEDQEILDAALLHDVLEDTEITRTYLLLYFPQNTVDMVDALSRSKWQTPAAEGSSLIFSLRRTIEQFPGVLLIKMADRYHNLRTIEGLLPYKQKLFLEETENYLLPFFEQTLMNISQQHYRDVGIQLLDVLRRHMQTVTHTCA